MSDNTSHEDINGMPVSPEKLAKVMALINNLLARADHPNTPPDEAKVARARAEREMARYRVEEASLDAESKAKMGIKPMHRLFTVAPIRSEFTVQYQQMLSYIVNHVGAMPVSKWETIDGQYMQVFDVFGFESDIAYAELLWASVRAAFKGQLEPEVDPNASDEDNVYRLRQAGIERGRIGVLMGWGGEGTNGPVKVTKVFKRACEARGEDPKALSGKGNNMKTFRRSYADAFVDTIWTRMWELRQARGQFSGEVVMANRMDDVKELLYTTYPSLRPKPLTPEQIEAQRKASRRRVAKPKDRPVNWEAANRGAAAARSIDLGSVGGNRVER